MTRDVRAAGHGPERAARPAAPRPRRCGTYDDGDRALRYAGKVGTGFDRRTLLDLRVRLDKLRRDTPPFDGPVREARARWAAPELVAQIAFTEWTRDGMLRHPRFLGLREDKEPEAVVREPAAG